MDKICHPGPFRMTRLIYQLPVEVSQLNPFTASSKRSCQHIEYETAADEGEAGGWEADENGMSNFIFSALFISLRRYWNRIIGTMESILL